MIGFYKLCVAGDLQALIEYVKLHHITAEDRAEYNYAFGYACQNGHLHVAQWLAEHFGLTVEDARSDNNFAFRWACGNGHFHVAQWLAEHFNLTIENARYNVNYAFHYACEKGRLHIAQWIIERFDFTKEDMKDWVKKEIVDQLDWKPLGPKLAVKLT